MLKQRWHSLVELPLQFRKNTAEKDMNRAINWISVCAILHNFLLQEKDPLDLEEISNYSLPEESAHSGLMQEDKEQGDGSVFREACIDAALQVGLVLHGIITFQRRVKEQQLRKGRI